MCSILWLQTSKFNHLLAMLAVYHGELFQWIVCLHRATFALLCCDINIHFYGGGRYEMNVLVKGCFLRFLPNGQGTGDGAVMFPRCGRMVTLHLAETHRVCLVRRSFERFVDWRQCAAVMQREAVTVTPSFSGGSNVVVA
jgi:hypothetical protein